MDKKTSRKILSKLRELHGDPETDLQFQDLFQLTVAVVLSAQTTDKQVNSVTPELFSRYPDFSTLAESSQKDVEAIIRPTGFYRSKASHIRELSRIITEEYNGKPPASREALMRLPGIGRKSANVILSIGFSIPALAVDTHVLRIANRLGYADSSSPEKVEKSLTGLIDDSDWTTAHLLIIRHGRRVCYARNPACEECGLRRWCERPGLSTSELRP